MEILCGLPDSFDVGSKLKRPALNTQLNSTGASPWQVDTSNKALRSQMAAKKRRTELGLGWAGWADWKRLSKSSGMFSPAANWTSFSQLFYVYLSLAYVCEITKVSHRQKKRVWEWDGGKERERESGWMSVAGKCLKVGTVFWLVFVLKVQENNILMALYLSVLLHLYFLVLKMHKRKEMMKLRETY